MKVDSQGRPHDALDRARIEIGAGGVVAYPTETVYGLGVDARDELAVEKLFRLKGRAAQRSVPVLIPSRLGLEQWVRRVTPLARRLIDLFWPGPLTIVLAARKGLPSIIVGPDETLGVRETALGWVQRWVRACGAPVTSTSANRSGEPPAVAARGVAHTFQGEVDLILDGGRCRLRRPSTVVDARGRDVKILREGALSEREIRARL